MKVIAVTNRKGGVGKSTVATSLAAGLATRGWRIGVVDTDSQGHAALIFSMPEANGLYNVMIGKGALSQHVWEVPPAHYSTPDYPAVGALYLLPSSDQTYKIPAELQQHESFLFLETLENMAAQFNLDHIIVDTNPTMTMFDGAVYMASDAYLYVTECARLSMDGVERAIQQMLQMRVARLRFLNRETRVMGIIPNKYRGGTLNHRENVKLLDEHFPGQVWPPLMLSTRYEQSQESLQPIFTFAPTSRQAAEMWQLVGRTEEALHVWQPV